MRKLFKDFSLEVTSKAIELAAILLCLLCFVLFIPVAFIWTLFEFLLTDHFPEEIP